MERGIVSVSQITEYLRVLVESDTYLSNVWVEGEVTDTYISKPGHFYFTITDGDAKLKCVAFRMNAPRVQYAVTPGAHVTVAGRVSIYPRDGQAQLIAEFADSSGMGLQALEYQRLRAKLEAEGLFDPLRKRPLPEFPQVIGVVTSPGGAVIHDIQTVLRRRFPLVHLLISPAQVQGTGAVTSIRQAFDLLLEDGTSDLIIIARGGGSAEDLSAFNDEGLARMVFASPIPVVSAIGHETDFTLLDDVADLRAPTPTAAAELSTPDVADFALELIETGDRMFRHINVLLLRSISALENAQQRLDRSAPDLNLARRRTDIADLQLRLDRQGSLRIERERAQIDVRLAQVHGLGLRIFDRLRSDLAGRKFILGSHAIRHLVTRQNALEQDANRLPVAWSSLLARQSGSVALMRSRLDDLSPISVFARGFSVVIDSSGEILTSVEQTGPGSHIQAIVRDGTIEATVDQIARTQGLRQAP